MEENYAIKWRVRYGVLTLLGECQRDCFLGRGMGEIACTGSTQANMG
jgi:hypothetical protein